MAVGCQTKSQALFDEIMARPQTRPREPINACMPFPEGSHSEILEQLPHSTKDELSIRETPPTLRQRIPQGMPASQAVAILYELGFAVKYVDTWGPPPSDTLYRALIYRPVLYRPDSWITPWLVWVHMQEDQGTTLGLDVPNPTTTLAQDSANSVVNCVVSKLP
jgi:hypothetical protein